ncbi:MAG: CRTAC1 family protein [Candidatus Polarisedimenticolia bacterium]
MKPARAIAVAGGLAALLTAAIVAAGAPEPAITFFDITDTAGISFRHVHGGSGEKYYVETMGSGACWFDHDNDGDIDLYVVNSGPLPGFKGPGDTSSRLYRNEGGGRFTDVTSQAGVGNQGRYGMGCTVGDIDGDNDRDLYVTSFGPNVMYRNDGGGRFTDVTAESGTAGAGWSASAAFGDLDNDGDLDLYVTRYIDFTLDNNKYCGERKPGYRAYCHPDQYNGVPDLLYRNRGNGQFEDASVAAGIADPVGKGLGVVMLDVNDDGWLDIYVANDKTINFLYLNKRDGAFRDISMMSGTGFSESGLPQAGMGTDAADVNGDGRQDLIVTNLDYETNELYLNSGDLTFTDATYAAGMGEANFLNVGFGADFLDYDNDADQDLLVVNGHILDNIELFKDKLTYAQPRSMMANGGTGIFREVGPSLGPAFAKPDVGRGLAVGDMDNDGDLDAFVVNNNRPAQLLRNEGGAQAGHWMILVLQGARGNVDAIGARVRVTPRGPGSTPRVQTLEVRAGSSYLSQNDVRLHVGLGRATAADIEVRWPGGGVQSFPGVNADRIVTLTRLPGTR